MLKIHTTAFQSGAESPVFFMYVYYEVVVFVRDWFC